MREKDFNTGLRGVLFEAKHYARMGPAIWLYGWLVLRQTHQSRGIGYVLGGAPITYREIEDETGFNRRTLEAWMRVLRREGYVQTQNVPAGISVRILKAKKHRPNQPSALRSAPGSRSGAQQTDLFRPCADGLSFAQPVARNAGEPPRDSADRGPSFHVANATKHDEPMPFAAPIRSSFVERIKENHAEEIHSHVENSEHLPVRNDQTSFGWENTTNRKPRNEERTLLRENNSRARSDGHTPHTVHPDQPHCAESRSKPGLPFAAPSQRHTQSPPETRQPQERFPWDLRKRMQLLRAEREEEVRRELYVGTGPEGRR